jgi:curved DNA-binding protein CbpA
MKDYYKILGVKPTASAEDVHARWIKLMRKFHPDRGTKGGVEDERVREINEAYGVLKDPSSRGQYDLRRAYQRKKRNLHLQRVVVPPVILIALFILGIIYLQRHRFALLAKPKNPPVQRLNQITTKLPIAATGQIKETNEVNEFDQTRESNERNQFNQVNATEKNQKPVLKAKPLPKIQKSVRSQTRERKEVNPTNPKNPRGMKNRAKSTNPSNPPNSKNSINPVDLEREMDPTSVPKNRKTSPLFAKAKTSVKAKKTTVSPKVSDKIDATKQAKKETNPKNPIGSRNPRTQINESNKSNKPNQGQVLAALKISTEPNDINPINESNKTVKAKGKSRINLINQINPYVAQLKESSLLATEGEVESFFAEYRERYARKDLEGLLSLFSSRAVENGRFGFEEMQKIYSDFFDKSEELRYQMEDTRIQIFQNAVEVWCLYKIEQTAKKGGKKNVWWGDIRWILIRENGNLKVRFLDYKPRGSE